MTERDTPAPGAQTEAQVSAQRRRTAQARAEREARLAANLRANIVRRKQQARARAAGDVPDGLEDDSPDGGA